MNDTLSFLAEKIAPPLAAAVVAWLLKDVVVGIYVQRREEARKEWLFRLRDVYCPIFFWSAVILFKKADAFGVKEYADALSKAVSILPSRQYFVFVRLLEKAKGQQTTAPSLEEIKKARDYVYSRIEVTNFALFRQPGYFDVTRQTDPLGSLRTVWRTSMDGLIQVLVWMALFGVLFGGYYLLTDRPVASVLMGVLLLLILLAEMKRRYRIHQELTRKLKT